MKPDSGGHRTDEPVRALEGVERAHLRERDDTSHVMFRYEAPPDLRELVSRFWVPVWSVPDGQEAPQRVLQHPVCLLVVTPGYARFYGVVSGLSVTTLSGDGWAVGVMLTPAAGHLLTGRPVAAWTDRHVDLGEVLGSAGDRLRDGVRRAMTPDPASPAAHAEAMAVFAAHLRPFLPVDTEGRLVNRLVQLVQERSDLVRVSQLAEELGLSERALQRLVHRRLGLTPKWLVQRRRLHEAAERLRDGPGSLGEVAAALGYADQAHFTHDFSRVTGQTPGQFVAAHGRGRAG